MRTLHSQTAVVNLATGATVLTHTLTVPALADLILEVGDGTSNLAATAATTLTIAITVDGVPLLGDDQTELVKIGRTRLKLPVHQRFAVAAGQVVAVKLSSDQAADTAVAVTATLSDAANSPVATVPRTQAVEAVGSTGNISRKQASQWKITVEKLAALPAANTIYFTAKRVASDADYASVLQVRLPIDGVTGQIGLIVLNGADPGAGRRGEGSITYESYVVDAVTYYRIIVTIEAEATAEVAAASGKGYVWDIKSVGTNDMELDSGQLRVTAGVTLTV